MPNTPTYILYHGRNTSKDKDSKKIWTRIGAVWPNKSGTLLLDSRVVELEGDAYGATNATQGNPLYQQAFDEAPLVLRDEVLLEALDKLASTVVAVMILFAIVNVPICLLKHITLPQ
jgi:hypothetical protein